MHPKRKHRLFITIWLLLGLTATVGGILYALRQNINVFYTPTQLLIQTLQPDQRFYVGGTVVKGSVKRGTQLHIQFVLSDKQHQVPVSYTGVLPDLFKAGETAVVAGTWNAEQHLVQADQVLAKHDENYSPTLSSSADTSKDP